MAGVAAAQEMYQLPPKELMDLVDAPATQSALTGPGDWILLARTALVLSIADLSQPGSPLSRPDPGSGAGRRTRG